MSRLFIAEKPSLARAIADAIPGPAQRRDGFIECGNGDRVAWCAGHILELAAPDAYNADYKQWRLEHLPITPRNWKLVVTSPDLLNTIKSLLSRASVVVHAGDPDREGQLLVDEVLVFLGYRGPVDRILISDLNVGAIRKALNAIEPNAKFHNLYNAALGRQRADWLYGLNMTRLYTLLGRAGGYDGVLSVGRVQTPLLGLIVRRDLEIEQFVPKPYYTVVAEIAGAAHVFSARWQPGPEAEASLDSDGRLVDAALASRLEKKLAGQAGTVVKATRERKKEAPPLPYSLADLQIDAGKRLGLSPKRTLDVCQALYETHRLITYPRSDCSYLPEGHLAEAHAVARAIASVEPRLAPAAAGADLTLRSRAWNDVKVTAHHAVIPTPRSALSGTLDVDERNVYGLIARRYLAQFYPPHEFDQLDVQLSVAGERLSAKGRHQVLPGWRQLLDDQAAGEHDAAGGDDENHVDVALPALVDGQAIRADAARAIEKKTIPPRRFTSATLVQAMTGISRFVTNPQIKQLLRETDGIGTPATQAQIIQTLFDRHYIEETNRQIVSTSTGRALIRALPDVATQPDMTALWEATLRKVHEGRAALDGFLTAVERQLAELITRARAAGALQLPGAELRPCPSGCGGSLRRRAGKSGAFWACSRYPECTLTQDAAYPRFRTPRSARRPRKSAAS